MKTNQVKSPSVEKVWIKTRYQGVYYRVSQGEKVQNGKPDKCFFIRYKKDGRRIMEKVGWGGDGYSAETAKGLRGKRLQAIWHGEELPKEKAKVFRFSEMADLYLKWAEENKSRDTDDKGRYENHLKDALGKKKLNEISPFDLERVKSALTKKGLAPATVRHCLILIREIFNKAKEWGKYQGDHPLKKGILPTLNNKRERFLSHEEADLLLIELAKSSTGKKQADGSVIRDSATHDQAMLALHCGLRAGEIFNIRGQDLDFQNGIIRIVDPKNNENRSAFMTGAVREMLEKRTPKSPGDYFFQERKTEGRIKIVSQTFDRAVEKLGFNKEIEDPRQRVVFHTLRHTFASWLAIQGTPLLTIKELLGHKTLAMTERYSHLSPDSKRGATLTLEADFNQSRNGAKVLNLPGADS